MARSYDVDELAAGVVAGDRGVLARALTLVESRRAEHRPLAAELVERLRPRTGGAIRVGISGLPGAGKSTLVERLGTELIERGRRVAVLAVDPSSSVSGGSILGDKTRMAGLAHHPEAFVRPSPSGGALGGVGRGAREVVHLLEAAGFGVVLVETVGVGQSEIAVSTLVDTFVVLLVAGGGDELQGIKRGILELAHVVAINKVDLDRAQTERARRDFAAALGILQSHQPWVARVLGVSAATGEGVDELWATVEEHRSFLAREGRLEAGRRRQRVAWMWELVQDELLAGVRRRAGVAARLGALESAVARGDRSPASAAEEILDALGAGDSTS